MFAPTRLLSTLCLAAMLATPALANGDRVYPREDRVYFSFGGEPRLPACDTASVLGQVAANMARADPSYFGGRRVALVDRVIETSYQVGTPSPLARRYCQGRATLSDGSQHQVYYVVVEHGGFVGVSWNVQACFDGLDRWHVYDGWCRTVRP